jgi:hypothetical protein
MPSPKPPLLPAEILRRMLRTARFDGASILVIAGAFALGSASLHDAGGTGISLMVAGAGAIELHGAGLLRHGEERGLRWLVSSQIYLMLMMLGYVAFSLRHVDLAAIRQLINHMLELLRQYLGPQDSERLIPQFMAASRQAIAQAGLTVDDFLRQMYFLIYTVVGLITVLYQGTMAIYYARRQTAVAAALRGH